MYSARYKRKIRTTRIIREPFFEKSEKESTYQKFIPFNVYSHFTPGPGNRPPSSAYPSHTLHINGLGQYAALCDCLLSLSVIFSKFIHAVAWLRTVFLSTVEWYSIVWMHHTLLIHSSVNRNWVVSLFWLLWTVYCYEHSCAGFAWTYVFSSLRYTCMCLGVELLGHKVTLFNFLRECQTVFPWGCLLLHSHQQCTTVPPFSSNISFSSNALAWPCQNLHVLCIIQS